MTIARLNRISRLGCGVLVLSLASQAAVAQTAYFSLEGDINAPGDQYDFTFDLTRSVTGTDTLFFETHTHGGGVNQAGDVIAASLFDSDLRLFNGLNAQIAQSDEISASDFDALLSWAGVQTDPNGTPMPDPLAADSYRLNLREFGNNNPGAFAVDLVGPDDAIVFTGGSPVNTGTATSLKFGSNDGGTATFNSASNFDLIGELVVAQTGSANLNLSGGTLNAGGLTTINTGGTVTQIGGTLNAGGGLTLDGGTYTRTNGNLNLAPGTTLTVQNGGLFDHNTTDLRLVSPGSNYLVTGIGSEVRNNDMGNRSFRVEDGSLTVDLGGVINGRYLELGNNASITIDGAGSTLNMTGGTEASFAHFVGFGGAPSQLTLSNNATATLTDTLGTELKIDNGTVSVLSGSSLFIDGLDMDELGTSTVTVNGGGSTITQQTGSTMTIGSASGSTGTLNIQSSSAFTSGNGQTTINPTGTVNHTGGTYNANGDILVDGGSLTLTGTAFNLAAGKNLTTSNNGQVNFTTSYGIGNGSAFTIDSGADLSAPIFIDVGNGSDGTLIVDGLGSSFTKIGASYWGSGGATGSVTIRNDATATLNDATRIARGAAAGTHGSFSIQSGADVTADELTIANEGTTGTGSITVTDAGTTLMQNGSAALIVGHATNGTATFDIANGATFTSGTGQTTVNANGSINHTAGTYNANGDILVDGGSFDTAASSFFNVANGVTFTARNDAQVNFNAAYNLDTNASFLIESGADMATTSFLDIGFSTDGTLIVDGVGSSLTTNTLSTSTAFWGRGGATADVTLRNGATANIQGVSVELANGGGASTATLRVESDADMTINRLDLNTGVSDGTAQITVTGGGSTLTQNPGSNLNLGGTGTGSATVTVEDDAVFNASSTGLITLHDNGRLILNNDGTFSATPDTAASLQPGGNGQTLTTSGTITSFDGNLRFDGGQGGSASGFGQTGGVGGLGGTLDATGGLIDLFGGSFTSFNGGDGGEGTLDAAGGNGGDGGTFNLTNTGLTTNGVFILNGGDGGNGDTTGAGHGGDAGTININSGSFVQAFDSLVLLKGGNGGTDFGGLSHGNGGDGGTLNVLGGSYTVGSGADLELRGGNGAGAANDGAHGLIDITGGTFVMNGGRAYTGSFQRSGPGVFHHYNGQLTIAGGTFDPGTTTHTINGAAPGNLPTLILTDGATAPGITDNMIVGDNNDGRLELLNGATLNTQDGRIGNNVGSDGEALIDGPGTVWTQAGGNAIVVGENGTGRMIVGNGGAVITNNYFVVGRNGTGDGTVHINSGGSVDATNPARELIVGEFGTAVVNVGPNGSLSSADHVFIAWFGSADGTLNVDGAGATAVVHKSLYVGGSDSSAGGTGLLSVNNDAQVSVADSLTNYSGGTIDISTNGVINATPAQASSQQPGGSGAILNHAGTLTSLDGNLRFDGGQGGGTNGVLQNAGQGGQGGTLNATGGTINLNNSSFTTFNGGQGGTGGNDSIGGSGGDGGTLNLLNTATSMFSSVLTLNGGDGGDGDTEGAGHGGQGGTLNLNSGTFTQGFDSLFVINGGDGGNDPFSGNDGNGGDGGTLNINGGTYSVGPGAELNLRGGLGTGSGTDGAHGQIGITGGTFEMLGGSVYTGSFFRTGFSIFDHDAGQLTVAGSFFDPNTSDYTIDGTDPTLTLTDGASAGGITGELKVGDSNRGRLELLNGSVLTTGDSDVGSASGAIGEVIIEGAGSAWNVVGPNSDLAIGEATGSTGSISITFDGALNIEDDLVVGRLGNGTATISNGGTVTSNGIFTGEAGIGVLTVGNGGILNTSFIINGSNNGTLNITGFGAQVEVTSTLNNRANGIVNLSDGELTAETFDDTNGGAFNFTGGTLVVNTFDGTLDQDGGRLAPGASPGTTTITGDYNLNSGTLDIEIGGLIPDTQHDFVDVLGAASLSGNLFVSLINGFAPSAGDSFDILDAASIVGNFSGLSLPVLAGNLGWDITNLNIDGTLAVVVTALPGDLDGDGFVGINDLNIVLGNWNQNVPPANPLADPSGDGFVGIDDLNAVLGNWNAGTPPTTTTNIPEPASMCLLLAGITSMSHRRSG